VNYFQEQFTAMRDLYMKNGQVDFEDMIPCVFSYSYAFVSNIITLTLLQGFVLVYSITAQSTFNDLQDLREQILRVKV
jgi:hypothetical protein